ncbi:hypothetical protein BV898_10170 [Hypsibius exemplaris]|uniref:Chromo domain-containing protein n=1 Tax=Hypsibius exemplaris TaxID=2072580 RepID=A0A1W0WKH7_HYPEX|nr:hypothetical protein BV898_10170 [Hypsibius exemplaris]
MNAKKRPKERLFLSYREMLRLLQRPSSNAPSMAMMADESDSEEEEHHVAHVPSPSSNNRHRGAQPSSSSSSSFPGGSRPANSSSSSSYPGASRPARPYTKLDEIRAHCTIDDNPYWLVEEIRDVRMEPGGKLLYLVKWVGYSENDNSWEPEENCSLARRLIAEFHQKSSNKTSQIAQQLLMSSMAKAAAAASSPKVTLPSTISMAPMPTVAAGLLQPSSSSSQGAPSLPMKTAAQPGVKAPLSKGKVMRSKLIPASFPIAPGKAKPKPYQRPKLPTTSGPQKKVGRPPIKGTSTQDSDSNHSGSTGTED